MTHGLHHVTAVTADIHANLEFYTTVLGLRLVKQTVNQDDVTAYHLFYADGAGTPGTDMTFFDWSFAQPKIEGSDQISRTYWRVRDTQALAYWDTRLNEYGMPTQRATIAGQEALLFTDPEGQRLGLITDNNAPYEGMVWDQVIPSEHALRGFYAVELSVVDAAAMADVLCEVMDWTKTSTYTDLLTDSHVIVCVNGDGGPGHEIYIREQKTVPVIASLAGSVHHVAWRVPDEQALLDWIVRLEYLGVPNSGVVDRHYFQSLYFRISNGILFELATDGPGFSVDEDVTHLGERLSLPPFLAGQRARIEAGLAPLH